MSPIQVGRTLVSGDHGEAQNKRLLLSSVCLVAAVCVLQFVYQFLLQHTLLLPFRLYHIALPAGTDAEEFYSMTHRLTLTTSFFASASLAGGWVLASLYLFVWSMVFSSKANFGRLLALNAYALLPMALFSVVGCCVLVFSSGTALSFLWGDVPLSALAMTAEDYKAYIPTVPLILALKTLSYFAEGYSLILLALNTSMSQRLSKPLSFIGAALYGLVFYAIATQLS
jgi:hypothetical protein